MAPFNLQSRRGAFLAFGLVLLLAVISVLGTLRIQREATRWVNHTHEVRERIDRTLSLLTDAETGQRGYLLTSDKSFLKPYEMAVGAISATLDDLQQLSVDNDVQKRALVAVRSDVHEKLAELAQTLSLHDSGQSAAALVIVHLGRGAAIMEQLRADLAMMRTAEDELMRQRTARARDANTWTIAAVVALGAMAVLLLWLMRTLMARDAARIRESEERLATTVASVGDAVISTDAQGLIERMNPVAEQLTGWTLAQATGKPLDAVFRIINEHSRETVESPLAKVLREGQVVGLANHTLLIAKNGTERPIEDSGAPIRGVDGSIAGVVLVFKDATERYAAERQLRESEERFRALAENIPQLAWIADAGTEGQVHWFNQKWFEYTGTTLEEMKGSGWHRVHHPEHAERVIQRFVHHVKEGLDWEDIFPLRAKDGEYRWFLSRMTAIRDASGKAVRIFGTNTDITDQRHMQEELQRLAGKLALSDERLRAAVAAVQGMRAVS